jgi:hypothetical protein
MGRLGGAVLDLLLLAGAEGMDEPDAGLSTHGPVGVSGAFGPIATSVVKVRLRPF